MAIHITVVGFGKEADTSNTAFLSHCGFLEEVAGKDLTGKADLGTVRTQYPDAVDIRHIAFKDVNIDCRHAALVFQKPFEGIEPDTEEATNRAELMGCILAETAGRFGSFELVKEVEGLFEDDEGNMAYVFKNVASAIEADIAKGFHDQLRKTN